MRILVFDTETTGFPSQTLALKDQPEICQFAGLMLQCDLSKRMLSEEKRIDVLICPAGPIPEEASAVHGITDDTVKDAPSMSEIIDRLVLCITQSDVVVGHNIDFDKTMMDIELTRLKRSKQIWPSQEFDTMTATTGLVGLLNSRGKPKPPTLTELHSFLFSETFHGAHNAMADVLATARCMKELLARGVFQPTEPPQATLF